MRGAETAADDRARSRLRPVPWAFVDSAQAFALAVVCTLVLVLGAALIRGDRPAAEAQPLNALVLLLGPAFLVLAAWLFGVRRYSASLELPRLHAPRKPPQLCLRRHRAAAQPWLRGRLRGDRRNPRLRCAGPTRHPSGNPGRWRLPRHQHGVHRHHRPHSGGDLLQRLPATRSRSVHGGRQGGGGHICPCSPSAT